jgi:hypothetical protein
VTTLGAIATINPRMCRGRLKRREIMKKKVKKSYPERVPAICALDSDVDQFGYLDIFFHMRHLLQMLKKNQENSKIK